VTKAKPSGAIKPQGAQKKGDAKAMTQKPAASFNGAKAKATGTPKKSAPTPKPITIQFKSPKQTEIVVRSTPKPKAVDAHNIILQVPAPRVPINKVVKTSSETRAQRAAETVKDIQNKREAMMNKARSAKPTAAKPSSLSERFAQSGSR